MSVMPAAKNEPDEIRIRKYRDTLVTGGFALIAFGVWTLLKSIVEASAMVRAELGNISYDELTRVDAQELRAAVSSNILFIVVMGVIIVILAVDLALRAYVGLSARAVGLQKKKKNGKARNGIVWLIFGVLLVALNAVSLVGSVVATGDTLKEHSILYYIVSLFVDVTSLVVTAELVLTGFRLRKLDKGQDGMEGQRNAA